jgi:HSP20 family protein
MLKKKSFFERLTGSIRLSDEEEDQPVVAAPTQQVNPAYKLPSTKESGVPAVPIIKEEEEEVGQLTVDVYQTPNEIIIQSMVAGVQPENLSITITRDMVTLKGKREEVRGIDKENYFMKELYWGSFARTVNLPVEIEPESSEAIEKHGLLIIKLPKINKDKQTTLRVKSI